MSAPARLAGFAVLLAAVFGVASLAGGAIGPDRSGERRAATGHVMGGHEAAAVRGLAVSEHGLRLDLATRTAQAGKPFTLAFRIVDADGTVRGFDVEHTKRLHLVVVRRDLTGFQHLHPEQQADGSWSQVVTLAEPGSYRVLADFVHDGKAYTLADDVSVDGDVRSRPLPAPADHVDTDGFRVTRDGLAFTVTRGGQAVALQDYLGAKGHLVALREGDLAFLHVHPEQDRLSFDAHFPSAGRYRLFLQFQVAGRVHTAPFTEVVR